jgi:dephospho-CoA kinase
MWTRSGYPRALRAPQRHSRGPALQVWVTEVPEEVAIQRLMDRNKISREDAVTKFKRHVRASWRLRHALLSTCRHILQPNKHRRAAQTREHRH